jgi:hypothetical protein
VETGETVAVFLIMKEEYEKGRFVFQKLALSCAQNKIKYVPVNVSDDFEKVLLTYLVENKALGNHGKIFFFNRKRLFVESNCILPPQ